LGVPSPGESKPGQEPEALVDGAAEAGSPALQD
jgi:hypothetical protein